jgi:DNA-binding MarR family transcriptional regulator
MGCMEKTDLTGALAGAGPAGAEVPAAGGGRTDVELIEEALTRIVRRAKQGRGHDQLMAAAGLSIERAAFAVAKLCEDGPVRLSDIAAKLDVNVSTISRHVQQLERDGLLRRSDDPRDRRAAMLHLTEEGRSALRRAWAARRARLAAIFDRWDPPERHSFAALLTRFARELEDPTEPGGRERHHRTDTTHQRTTSKGDRA